MVLQMPWATPIRLFCWPSTYDALIFEAGSSFSTLFLSLTFLAFRSKPSSRPISNSQVSELILKIFPIQYFYRVLPGGSNFTSSAWLSSNQVQSHKFPPCSITSPTGSQQWLAIEVHFLKREYFMDKSPLHCPLIEFVF
jgi:hypothetical protein